MTTVLEDRILYATNTTYMTHNIHPYPAKFIPQIPHHFIGEYSNVGDCVLDPFCGSGTTLVEAALAKRNSIGVDVNPIATLVSRAKTTLLDGNEMEYAESIITQIRECWNGPDTTKQLPDFDNRDHWFKREVGSEIAVILDLIQGSANLKVQDFLKAIVSAIVVSVSNQCSDTRYAAIDKNIKPGDVIELYAQKALDAFAGLKEFVKMAESTVTLDIHCRDSRDLSIIDTNSVDLVVTSPPYPNVYDYYLYHKQRMNCLGMDYHPVKDNEIGSRLRYSSYKEDISTFHDDMFECLAELHRVVKPEKTVVVVIGDSIVQGQIVDGFDVISDVGREAGLTVTNSTTYSLDAISRTFGKGFRTKGKREHIVVLRNGT